MLISDEVWFSNPLYMNDWDELRFGMNAGAIAFRGSDVLRDGCGSAKSHSILINAFDHLYNVFDQKHALDTYVLCPSRHDPEDNDGLLSMWRGYGRNGAGVAVVS